MEPSTRSSLPTALWRLDTKLAANLDPSTSKDFVLPRCDRTLFADYRFVKDTGAVRVDSIVLKEFYRLEQRYRPSSKYFECMQSEVTVEMRKILVQWMFEVCEEERCSCEVFPLAVSYLDRFLSVETVHKQQLQALGAACLFLSSKVKETQPFAATRLEKYTDDSVSISELLSWELLVLNRLNWDLASLTAFDFLDQFLPSWYTEKDIKWRTELNYRVAELSMDFDWATRLPSEIAREACLVMTGRDPLEIARQVCLSMMSNEESPQLSPYDYAAVKPGSEIDLCIMTNGSEQSQVL